MDKVIQLKTQLAEAAKLGLSNNFGHQRLSVILLDNFVEIQLAALMENVFMYDSGWYNSPKKYSYGLRKKIKFQHADLLKACKNEDIINEEERKQLEFCHEIRNNLYHVGKEDHLLTNIALLILFKIISTRQPTWKSARNVMVMSGDLIDPYVSKSKQEGFMSSNSQSEWENFLAVHFNFLEENHKTVPSLIYEHLMGKLDKSQDFLSFLKEEHPNFNKSSENWELNEYMLEYSFFSMKSKALSEIEDRQERNEKYRQQYTNHKKNWKFIKANRIETLENSIRALQGKTAHRALEIYISKKSEIYLIFDTLSDAVSDLESQIDGAIEDMKLSKI
ncbi:hypothetical protein EZ428_09215 [Pedobacter frigiditerrae]|uniref:Uncharacterized protein n=1 Tax=Pedobacter frigiditerrae TaxID=2530452 RepID=A0A4R0MYD2_9SPHI|nr:hypothetical protein [Pedobacter frigiditerrae]TCC91917.1 hypothetical protein EZ428_09215 [Pedobacter frigiditerrae]